MKNVLVIGGSGFIGTNIVNELLDKGYRVSILDLPNSDRPRLDIKTYYGSLEEIDLIKKIKKEIGKVLLVFPSHSVKDLDVEYNYSWFNSKILAEKSKYDTLLVCLYHLDAQNEKVVSNYQELGCTIVCAGH
ncbi:MAG: NAD(P)-dependent dehydrogenase (short-subunit alcohol dehydrogenase family) [Flavobacteriaceae bacterium]|jgi:NAD(P)-dependent dehydrogenase (short-subunit alcohol dehydrogenase family)